MLVRRLRERVPSAMPLGRAVLRGYELRWHKRGKDGSGKCDVWATDRAEAQVHGVLFELAATEKPRLDHAEGLGVGYDDQVIEVTCNGHILQAQVYVATPTHIDPSIQPFSWYRALVLAGAREHRLPPAYIQGIEAVAAIHDPDPERQAIHDALIRAAQPWLEADLP
ncbi:gamma-glutamylcyclotransferase [Cyanobium sp. ATX 6F1]|nr:gamma-glutamylcyclotransferase [Cyanobium sp. ATX 6F1]